MVVEAVVMWHNPVDGPRLRELPPGCGLRFLALGAGDQQRIVVRSVDLFTKQELRSILIDSPTGSGKTVMGLLIARALVGASVIWRK